MSNFDGNIASGIGAILSGIAAIVRAVAAWRMLHGKAQADKEGTSSSTASPRTS